MMANSAPIRRRSMPLALAVGLSTLLVMVLLWQLNGIPSVNAAGGNIYVDQNTGSDEGFCQDPGIPCATVGYGISQASSEDSILVTGGTYTENLKIMSGMPITIRGGYTINDSVWMPTLSEATVINGGRVDSAIDIRANSNTTLENLTITGGKGIDDPTFGAGCGGLKIQDSDVIIRNSVIVSNTAGVGMGGGICTAGDFRAITLTVDSVIISDNDGLGGGGALNLFHTTAFLANTLIDRNTASYNAVLQVYPDPGATSQITFQNCTIVDNDSSENQVAIDTSDPNVLIFRNSILWNNGDNIVINGPCTDCVRATYSDIETTGVYTGTGNINADPLFVDTANGDYRLGNGSPVIDKGSSVGAPAVDLDGVLRDNLPDMGAYEWTGYHNYLPVMLAGTR